MVSNLSSLGVNNKAVKVKSSQVDRPKIALHEVTKEAIMEMDINELLANMQAYEAEVLLSETSEPGEGLTISTVQTLITLYQKAIEYFSAMDNNLYVDVRNRMQQLLARPDVEALMTSAQEEQKREDGQKSGAGENAAANEASEEVKGVSAVGDGGEEPKQAVSYKIDDDDDEEEEDGKDGEADHEEGKQDGEDADDKATTEAV